MRAYFGGTFNPPHVGHDQILLALLRRPELTSIHIVPTSQNPLKDSADGLGFDFEERWALVKTWIAGLDREDQKKVVVESLEIDRARQAGHEVAQYTWDSFQELHGRHANSQWALVLGSDLLLSLSRWKEIEKLLSLFSKVFIFPREGSEGAEIPEPLYALTSWEKCDVKIPAVSSTEIRQSLDQIAEDSDGAVLPRVKAKILDLRA